MLVFNFVPRYFHASSIGAQGAGSTTVCARKVTRKRYMSLSFDSCAGQERVRKQFRSSFVTQLSDRDSKNAGGGPLLVHISSPAPPDWGGAAAQLVHEMTLVKDLCARPPARAGAHLSGTQKQRHTRRHRRQTQRERRRRRIAIRRVWAAARPECKVLKSLCVHASNTHHRLRAGALRFTGGAPQFPRHACRGGQRKPHSPTSGLQLRPPARSIPGLVNRGKHP